MTKDGQLLRQYARQGSEAAFSQLIARHLNLVHSVCLREVRDAALAEDVTQVVFLLLAKKAPALGPDTRLAGWLFQTARFACKNALRREARRKLQEQRAGEQMLFGGHDENALWDRIEPGLNDALASLGAKDREAVLLRFAGGLSFPELGTALGTSEDAARMRLNRAVDRLRRFFAKQGVTLSGAALVGLLAKRAVQAAPAACAAAATKIAGSVAAGGSTGVISPNVHSQLQGALKAMTISKLKLAATIAIGAALAGSLPFVTRAQNHKVTTTPQAVLPNPHPILSNTATRLGSLSLPAVPGWTKEYGNYPPFEVVYYKPAIAEAGLSAKVVYMPRPKGVSVQDLSQEKAQIDKDMQSILSPGETRTILASRIILYQQQPALLHIRDDHFNGRVSRVKGLMFNRGSAQYQVYLYARPKSPGALKMGEKFWQRLTGGLRDQRA